MRLILQILFVLFVSKFNAQDQIATLPFDKRQLESNIVEYYSQLDLSFQRSESTNHYSKLNLLGQTVAGYGLGIGLASLPIYLRDASGSNNQQGFAISAMIFYVVGSAVGVYSISQFENKELSFWGTLGYSALGGVVGLSIAIITFDQSNSSSNSVLLALILPTFSAMIYSTFISDCPKERPTSEIINSFNTHQHLIQHSKLFDMELIRIRL